MYKRLLKDASVYSISSLLARGFSLITVPIYTRILSPSDYGALDLLSYTAMLVVLVMGAALDQAVARFYLDATENSEKKRIASTVLIYNLFVFALLIPLVVPLASQLAHKWLDDQVDETTVVLVFIYIWMHAIFYIANNQLRYLFLSKQYALCNIGNTIFSIVLSFVFVVYLKWGVFGVFLGQVIGAGLFALLSLYYARESYALVFHWKSFKRMLVYSLPLVPGTLAFYLMQYVDRYVINQLTGLYEVGLYGIGARVASLVNLFLMGFQGAWSPIIFKSFREKEAPEKFKVVFNYYLFAVLTILVGLSLFGKEILLLLTTKTFSQGFVVVPLLVLAAILASIGQYFTYGIQIAQKSHFTLFLNSASLLINVVLNYVLIPRLGIIGAALATVLSFVFLSVVGMSLSQKLYYVPYRWVNILAAGLLATAISNSVPVLNIDITWQVVMAKVGVAFIVMFILSRLLDIPLDARLIRRIKAHVGSQPKL
jgi:O-antigen/teichoic acid export membrane protein